MPCCHSAPSTFHHFWDVSCTYSHDSMRRLINSMMAWYHHITSPLKLTNTIQHLPKVSGEWLITAFIDDIQIGKYNTFHSSMFRKYRVRDNDSILFRHCLHSSIAMSIWISSISYQMRSTVTDRFYARSEIRWHCHYFDYVRLFFGILQHLYLCWWHIWASFASMFLL